jgi:antitoxin (DNA-binding transcriptional repressor) of toxin-antitoxin stability system
VYYAGMTVIKEVAEAQLAELVKQVQAGDDVLLTQGAKPVARLVAAQVPSGKGDGASLKIRSFKGHKVLTPTISQGELAEEMFGRT